jgi:hexulose-6-phosphate isomerase
MRNQWSRREFLWAAAGLAGAVGLGLRAASPEYKTKLYKALIVNKPDDATMASLKAAGYHGVEGGVIGPKDAEACRAIAEKHGMRIHSVIRGWADFNVPSKAQATFDHTVLAIETAAAFGADAVLLVPCRIGGMKMPKPWEFEIEFDERTGHLRRVAAGDNAPYEDYIKAHNAAIDASREWVEKLIPIAEKHKVVVALENVWNNLWVKPAIFAHFVGSFKSQWVKAYFDIGNHVKYAPSQDWIRALGKLVAKCHAKDFKVNRDAPNGGQFVNIRDGDVNWPEVRQALEDVGYNGFLTVEGGSLSPKEHSERLDLIFAGK